MKKLVFKYDEINDALVNVDTEEIVVSPFSTAFLSTLDFENIIATTYEEESKMNNLKELKALGYTVDEIIRLKEYDLV